MPGFLRIDINYRKISLLSCCALTLMLYAGSTIFAQGPSIHGSVKVINRQGILKNDHSGVVVFLDELENPPVVTGPNKTLVIDQVNKKFIPNVLPVLAGTTVEFPNNDSIYHNVFSLSKTKPFDLGLYARGVKKSVTFDQPGLVKVYCNIHPQMVANVLVLSNPHFTVSDKDGNFKIENVPLGNATVRTWFSRTKQQPEKRIQVSNNDIRNVDLQVIEDVRLKIQEESVIIKHKNKWGQDYPQKY